MGDSQHNKINTIIGETENVSFILWKNPYGLFDQPNTYMHYVTPSQIFEKDD